MIVATTQRNERKAIVTGGAIMSSSRVFIFIFLFLIDLVGQMGSPNMTAAVSHNPVLPCKDTPFEFANIPPIGIGPSNLLYDILI
jgi:hypothetical protein